MADAFANKREEVEESAGSVMMAIEHNESFSGRAGNPGEPLLEKMLDSIVKQFDERNGGFGSQPKFPHPGALDLLIDAAGRGGEEAARAKHVAVVTLEKMAAGGIYDQLAGGFHRYSVDERWVVPHFEKMAYDNCELLKNYAHAFQTFVEPEFAHVAKDVLRWMDEWLSDRELGGFYASQDADDSLDDDGDYFTWTVDEAKAVLSAEEFAVAEKYFQLGVVGDMHHNPAKNVLRPAAGSSGGPLMNDEAVHEWGTQVAAVKRKMYAARLLRKTPYVDRTVYTGWNGMCISAYLAAGRALGLSEPVEFALKSLERVVASVWDKADGMAHVVAYGEGVAAARIPGVLEDYAFVAAAALDAWEATGEFAYYATSKEIADAMLARFYDAVGGGFFDTEKDAAAIGALSARRKPLQDSPTPAGNAVAAAVLLRLAALTGEDVYETRAQETLETFAGVVEHFGLYAASYGLALRRAVAGSVQVCVIGDDDVAEILAATAMAKYAVNKSVIRLRKEQLDRLPPALAETLPHLPASQGSVAVVCRGNTCLPPVGSGGELLVALSR